MSDLWLGVVTPFAVVFLALVTVILIDVLVGMIASISWHIWTIRNSLINNGKPKWRRVPRSFVRMSWELIGWRKAHGSWWGSSTWYSGGAQWNGVFDWWTCKRPHVQHAKPPESEA